MDCNKPDMQQEKIRITADASADGSRLDAFLAGLMDDTSRSRIQLLIKEGGVLLNGKAESPSRKLRAGDEIVYSLDALRNDILPENMNLDVLHEDRDIIVLNKPAGLVVHPDPHTRNGTLVNALLAHCNDEYQLMMDDDARPGIVHRLDKDTSGVLVVAKNPAACSRLKEDFKEHKVRKIYLAVVSGCLSERSGEIRLPIGRHPRIKTRMAVVDEGGKEAWTEYRVAAERENVSVVKVRLHTGRTHQIRVHFSHIGHPVLGDAVYGGGRMNCGMKVQRQMLHAWRLAFNHPASGKKMLFTAPLPVDFTEILEKLECRLDKEG